jgi:kynurenine formamidase
MVAMVGLTTGAGAENNPVDEQWWPTEFGADDQAGATNYITPEKRLEAVQLVKQGKVATLGMQYHSRIPVFPGRTFALSIPGGGGPTHNLPWKGDNFRQTFMDELVTAEIGQAGTQFDSLAHPMIMVRGAKDLADGNYFSHGPRLADIGGPRGLSTLGPEHVGSFFTRGVLIDVAALKGVDVLPETYEITADDLREALARQGMSLQPGDAAIVHTGWGRWWDEDPARYVKSSPGIGVGAAEWLAAQDPMLVGADNSSVNILPGRDASVSEPVHQILLVVHGILLLENLKLDEVVARRAHEFALIVQPLKIQGGSGSSVAPVAVR